MSGALQPQYEHLKPRYSDQRVLRIFGISRATLRRWISNGEITPVRLSARHVEFEVDEVERVYLARRGATR